MKVTQMSLPQLLILRQDLCKQICNYGDGDENAFMEILEKLREVSIEIMERG